MGWYVLASNIAYFHGILDTPQSNLHCCQDAYLVFEVLEAPSAACGGTFKGRWKIWSEASHRHKESKIATFFDMLAVSFKHICIYDLFMTNCLGIYSCTFCWCLFCGNSELYWLFVFHVDGFWCGSHAFCTDFESMPYYAYHKQAPIILEDCKHVKIDLVSHDIERRRRTLESHLSPSICIATIINNHRLPQTNYIAHTFKEAPLTWVNLHFEIWSFGKQENL